MSRCRGDECGELGRSRRSGKKWKEADDGYDWGKEKREMMYRGDQSWEGQEGSAHDGSGNDSCDVN